MRFDIIRPFAFNLTGFDAEPATFDRGECEVATPGPAARLAAWLERNPAYGSVITEGTTGGADAPAPESATSVVPSEVTEDRPPRRTRKGV